MTLYPYTADRSRFDSGFALLGAMVLAESILLIVLILIFARAWWLRGLLIGSYLLIGALLAWWLRAPLRTHHLLTDNALELRYGTERLTIPRPAIRSITSAQERIEPLMTLRGELDTGRQELRLAFSEQGQLRLTLHEPVAVRWNRKSGYAQEALFNVDDRAALLAALEQAVPVATGTAPPALPAVHSPTPSVDSPIRLRVEGLARRFGSLVAVEALSLTLVAGEIYGFLGENGAGKSTALRMMVGLLEPSAGRVEIEGHHLWREPEAAKQHLGYVADRPLLYERLSGREQLHFLAQMRGLPQRVADSRADRLLHLLGLEQAADRLCGGYSLGMKRRLSLAGALLHEPTLLLLDEPLNGLDPRGARDLKRLLRGLAAQGTTILLSTHDLAAAESLCHRIGIMQHGRLIAEGTLDQLRRSGQADTLEEMFFGLTAPEVA